MPTLNANGISVHYERSGGGPPLLFCNGSGSTLETSAPLIAPFTERFDVLAYDQRGLGRTEIPPTPYTMAQYAADAIGLLDAIGWDRCRVVGISFGGMVAQEIAVTWPDRVERLALLCTSPGGTDASSYPLQDLAKLPVDERIETGLRILDTRFTPEWLAAHPSDQALVEMLAGRAAADKTAEQLRGEAGQIEARSHHDVYDRLPRISCPTFVASGRFDGIAPVANGEAIANQVPDSVLRVYDGGHAFIAQDAAAFPEILDFLVGPAA
ncbi:MAG: alpha/beta fold hydrolase [Acidimicrobiia bacterium]